jgi:hypothetical protein
VGSTTLRADDARAFTSGLHAAFYSSMGPMVLAALLSATRATARLAAEGQRRDDAALRRWAP